MGSLSYALNVSAAMLALGAILSAFLLVCHCEEQLRRSNPSFLPGQWIASLCSR
jgi:hypothetical protein